MIAADLAISEERARLGNLWFRPDVSVGLATDSITRAHGQYVGPALFVFAADTMVKLRVRCLKVSSCEAQSGITSNDSMRDVSGFSRGAWL